MNIKSTILEEICKLLNETPDSLKLPNGEYLHCSHRDAYPFFMVDNDYNNIMLGDASSYHFQLVELLQNIDADAKTSYYGRIWIDRKVISLWNYPSKDLLYKILSGLEVAFELEHKLNIEIFNDEKYLIEVYTEDGESTVIPISEYTGRTFKNPERVMHLLPATEKQKLKDRGELKAYNTIYHNKRMEAGTKSKSAAEYKFIRDRGIGETELI